MTETAARISPTQDASSRLRPVFRKFINRLARSMARRAQRSALAELEPHLLDDIGRTPTEARREASKPFWR